MMIRTIATACAMLGISALTYGQAIDAATNKSDNPITAAIQAANPAIVVTDVAPSPVKGLYRVSVQNGGAIYVTEDGKHFIAGDLFSVSSGAIVNVSEQERSKERVATLASLKAEDMIVFAPKGEVKATINVFTDIDCGFCQKLHQEVPALNAKGIEVRYLAFPRAGMNTNSSDKLTTAWCADDPQETLTKLKNRESVQTALCDDAPIAEQLALGGKLGVRGTPAIFLADGTSIPGYRPADELAKAVGVQ